MNVSRLPPLGLQPIILGQSHDLNSPAVLDQIAAMGFAGVESAGKDPAVFRGLLDARGLRCVGIHVTPSKLLDWKAVVETCRIMGCTEVCNSGLYDWHQRTRQDYALAAAILNRAGRHLRAEGIHLHYHNHDFEFEPNPELEGRTALDYFLEAFDPACVDLCVDVGWVLKAGQDPAAFLRRHAGQVGYLHLKDWDDQGWCVAGQGKVDFASVLEAAAELPALRAAVVEQDRPRGDALEDTRAARRYYRETFGY